MKQPKISIYKNPQSNKFRWQISSMEEFETSEAATNDLNRVLYKQPENLRWIWDLYWKKWRCPACGKKISKSYPHCPYCGMKLIKGE